MNVKWILEPSIFKDSNIPENIFKSLNIPFYKIEYIPFLGNINEDFLPSKDECVVSYGTINSIRKLKHYFGTYLREDNFLCNRYMSTYINDDSKFLNSNHVFVTFNKFKNNRKLLFEIFGDPIFVRPNTGMKSFTGLSITKRDFNLELNCLENLRRVQNHELILVSKSKKILEESRFIICDNEIVGQSRYNVNGELKEDLNIDESCVEFVKTILKEVIEPPEECYTIDIALTENGPKIIELNSFSCAGWYAADAENIIKKISEYTWKIYKDNNNEIS